MGFKKQDIVINNGEIVRCGIIESIYIEVLSLKVIYTKLTTKIKLFSGPLTAEIFSGRF